MFYLLREVLNLYALKPPSPVVLGGYSSLVCIYCNKDHSEWLSLIGVILTEEGDVVVHPENFVLTEGALYRTHSWVIRAEDYYDWIRPVIEISN